MRPDPDIVAAEHAEPRAYVCYQTRVPPALDGRGACAAWTDAPWTDDFVDIRGTSHAPPRHRTRVRMLHDDNHLYVHAELEEPHVWGSITRTNAVIFHDNDFEVFLDPDGDNHEYYELEVNALGTTWQLTLPAPYRTGAQPRDPDELDGLRVAVAVDGTINDPRDEDRGWSVEAALPFEALRRLAPDVACPPRDGDVWRVNFSRVQWPHDVVEGAYRRVDGATEDNWVWSPQGVVDMHRPATWGRVQFSSRGAAEGCVDVVSDATHDARNALMGVWERMRRHGSPTDDRRALGLGDRPIAIAIDGDRWTASLRCGDDLVIVNERARLVVARG